MKTTELGSSALSATLYTLVNDRITSAVIIASVLVMYIGYNWPMHTQLAINWAIIIYFAVESAIKINHLGRKTYFNSVGHITDFVILTASLLLMLLPFAAVGSLAALRAVRLITMLRLMRFVPNSEQIVEGLIRATKAARTVLILLFVLMIMAGIIGYSLFNQSLPEFFATPFTALNSVFSIFTIENWNAIPESALGTGDNKLFYAVNAFVIAVLVLGGFVALSMANAVFVDEMVSDNNDELKEQIASLEKKVDLLLEAQSKRN